MAKDQSTTSHPAVRRTIDQQSVSFFSQIAQKHVTASLKIGMTAGVLLILCLLLGLFAGPQKPPSQPPPPQVEAAAAAAAKAQRGVAPGDNKPAAQKNQQRTDHPQTWWNSWAWWEKLLRGLGPFTSQALLFVAITYFVVGINNRRNRTRFFASALAQTAELKKWRDRFQISRVFKGGKIGRVLNELKFKKKDNIDIQWTFFYREEHSSRLFDDCIKDQLSVRILLCSPSSESLLIRVQDMKRDYVEDWNTALAELSLGNLTFAREYITAARRDPKLLKHCKVRFTDTYVGRPQVIIYPPKLVGASSAIYSAKILFKKFWNFLFSDNFDVELQQLRAGMGIYLTQESSKYPFFEFRPEPIGGDSSLVPNDTAELFRARWDSATALCNGEDPSTLASLGDAETWVVEQEEIIYRKTLQTPETPSAEAPVRRRAQVADLPPSAGIQLGLDFAESTRKITWGPNQNYTIAEQIAEIRKKIGANGVKDRPDAKSPIYQENATDIKILTIFRKISQILDNRFIKFFLAACILIFAIFLNYIAESIIAANLANNSFSNPAILWANIIKIFTLLAQTISTAFVFSVVDPRTLGEQFEGCRDDLEKFIAEQNGFDIVNIVEGGKFNDILSHMDVGYGDFIFIHWSYLQHEQASEDFGRRIVDDNLFVRLMMMTPFSVGLTRRVQDLTRDYEDLPASMLSSKSCGNLDFIRRRDLYGPTGDNSLDGAKRFDVRYSPLEMGRPMIIVCKPKDRGAPIDFANLRVKQVAMGHFLTGESSKYPFIIFGGRTDSEDAPPPVCTDALDFFAYRWKTASSVDAPSAGAKRKEDADKSAKA